jgi:lipoprotein-releasing system ATP-binding protein
VEFPSRSSVAIVGKSGIGKSTLLHLLGGLDRPSGGSILYDGLDIAGLSGDDLSAFRGRRVGFIFQFHHLLPEFTARENVAMPLVIAGLPERDANERAQAMIARVGLSDRADHLPGQLSGGEQQRVAIARAVVGNPAVVLADEPTGSLDVHTARGVRELLAEIHQESESTLVAVTHSMEFARTMDLVMEMAPGGALSPVDGR